MKLLFFKFLSSSLLCAAAFLAPSPPLQVSRSKEYLRGLETPRRSRYSRSWGETKRVGPLLEPKAREAKQKKPRLHTSESGAFRLEHVSSYNFSHIGGYEDVKEELNQTIDFLKNPTEYSQYNVRLPRGVLLSGPPGTGKTLLAKCLAGEAGLPFIATSGSVFLQKFVGVGASNIRELFDFARSQAPCIIFIDELESVARQRSGETQAAAAERDQTLNQLLVEMDGFTGSNRVLVVAATNRDDIIDEALLRPGRFDKQITVGLPDGPTRSKIIEIHARKKPLNVSTDELVELTAGLSGAGIECLLNDAVLQAIRQRNLPVSLALLETVLEQMIVGHTTNKMQLSSDTLYRVGLHECGHCLASLNTKFHGPLKKVSIASPSGTTLGYTIFGNNEASLMATKELLEERISVLLGGRIAEEIVYGEEGVSCGAAQDLSIARKIAEEMVFAFGFGSKVMHSRFSERSREAIDEDVERIVQNAYKKTRSFLDKHVETLLGLTEILLEKKTLTHAEILDCLETPVSSP